tara:strand:+ start:1348 stop:1500 length:153 start_codon:yes stop_codon:yes gene_type:complete
MISGEVPVVSGVIAYCVATVKKVLHLVTAPAGLKVSAHRKEGGTNAVAVQ